VARVGRPPSCSYGECQKCRNRVKAREVYQALSLEERRAVIARRDPEKVRAADRARSKTPERVRQITTTTRNWRKRHPERVRAHSAVARALRSGRLKKQPCEECGSKDVHAHHDDYSKPLEVRWLCPLHHGAERKVVA